MFIFLKTLSLIHIILKANKYEPAHWILVPITLIINHSRDKPALLGSFAILGTSGQSCYIRCYIWYSWTVLLYLVHLDSLTILGTSGQSYYLRHIWAVLLYHVLYLVHLDILTILGTSGQSYYLWHI